MLRTEVVVLFGKVQILASFGELCFGYGEVLFDGLSIENSVVAI